MRVLILFLCAAVLPLVTRFQETKVFQDGKVIFERSTYGQKPIVAVMALAAVALLTSAWVERRKLAVLGRGSRFVRLWPIILAVPALWQNWSVARFGGAGVYTEIKTGLGGPMTGLFFLTTATLFVAFDAYWRQKENA